MEGTIATHDVSDHTGNTTAPYVSGLLVILIYAFFFIKGFGNKRS